MIKILNYDYKEIMVNEDHIIEICVDRKETHCIIEMSDGRKIMSRTKMDEIQKRIEEHKARSCKPKPEKTTKYLVTKRRIMM